VTSEIVILWPVLLVFIVYLVAAAGVGLLLSRALNLPPRTGRTLVFSLATRNSFVMLPLALALPGGWSAAAVVIVMQSLVELFGMSVFLRWVPEHLIPDKLADRKV
jgi:ACR3 family arsenite transporter